MPVLPDGTITGTEDADTLTGGVLGDTLLGLGGDDSLIGDDGNDSLVGGDGNDTLRGGWGDDTLLGGDGDDEIEGLYGNDVIDTGAGNDHVFGRDGDDLIYGREGDDHLIGSIGTDTVFGGAGNDTLAGSQGNDEMHGGDGNDLVFIGTLEGSDRIFLDAGNDLLDGGFAGSSFYGEGGSGNDTMRAGVGDDTLLGGTGDDVIDGGAGNDLITGGGDTDIVTGGDGDDVFILLDVPGALHITDFGANGAADLIDLSQLAGYDSAEALSEVMTTQDGISTFRLTVSEGTLTLTIAAANPLTAEDFGLTGTLSGTVLEDTPPDEAPQPLETFTLEGPDAGYFTVDGQSGEIANIFWFTPNYAEVWDANADHIYEVTLVERDANGTEVARDDLELVVGPGGSLWRAAGSDDMPGGSPDETPEDPDLPPDPPAAEDGPRYILSGEDAAVFTVDAETGEVGFQPWFTPNYAEVWDMDRDHVYEVTVIAQDASGVEISREALELVVSEQDAQWQAAAPDAPDTTPPPPAPDAPAWAAVDGSGGTEGLTYALSGADAAIFEVDAQTGIVTPQAWFTPSFADVWDMDRDHAYEITVTGSDADGAEVSRVDLELVVSETDAVWQEAPAAEDAPEEDTPAEEPAPENTADGSGGTQGLLYTLAGEDAAIFEVEADTGLVSYQPWFTPNYEEVWDLDRDHIYEISVLGTDDTGAELSRVALELVVTPDDAIWQPAAPSEAEALMNAIAIPMPDEDTVPAEEEMEEPADLLF